MAEKPIQTTTAAQVNSSNRVHKGDAPYQNVLVIINPAAGQDRPILGAMNRAFHDAGVNWDVRITKKDGDALRFAQEAIAAGVNAVAVYGGDGTVMEVANGMVGSQVPLAIFPGGTANVMSVELGIPGDLAEAMALVCGQDSYVRSVDVGRVGERYFLLRCGIGFEAQMIQNTAREQKDQLGRLAYVLSALQTITTRTVARYRLTLDGETVEADAVTLMVANSGNFGLPGLTLAKTISVSDGLLDILAIRDTDVGSLLQMAASALGAGDPLLHWQAREIKVESDPPQDVILDGEPIGQTPLEAAIIPDGLHVIVPRQALSGAQAQAAEAQQTGDTP